MVSHWVTRGRNFDVDVKLSTLNPASPKKALASPYVKTLIDLDRYAPHQTAYCVTKRVTVPEAEADQGPIIPIKKKK